MSWLFFSVINETNKKTQTQTKTTTTKNKFQKDQALGKNRKTKWRREVSRRVRLCGRRLRPSPDRDLHRCGERSQRPSTGKRAPGSVIVLRESGTETLLPAYCLQPCAHALPVLSLVTSARITLVPHSSCILGTSTFSLSFPLKLHTGAMNSRYSDNSPFNTRAQVCRFLLKHRIPLPLPWFSSLPSLPPY